MAPLSSQLFPESNNMPPQADRTTCRRPSCFRTFKGERGLRIHLGIVKKCGHWYAQLRRKKSPSATDELSGSEVESVLSSSASANTSSTTSGRSFKFPWSSAPKRDPGEIHNPSGIPLPWSFKRGKHRSDPPQPAPSPDEQPLIENFDVNPPLANAEDDNFLDFSGEDPGENDPQVL